MKATIKCPHCGASSTGRFCAECGAALGDLVCPHCQAKVPARAKFCAECGGRVGSGRPAAPSGALSERLPWIIAGVAVLAVAAAAIAVFVSGRSESAAGAPFATGAGPGGGMTDLAQMTPRDAADRLFDRVARAEEAGDTAEVSFFGPMTLQAYDALTELDADARLHIGLVQLALGSPAGAVAQADTIQSASRSHLFASLLRARAAQRQGNTVAARQAFRDYLGAYESEMGRNLPEYGMHSGMLSQAREEAQRVAGGS